MVVGAALYVGRQCVGLVFGAFSRIDLLFDPQNRFDVRIDLAPGGDVARTLTRRLQEISVGFS